MLSLSLDWPCACRGGLNDEVTLAGESGGAERTSIVEKDDARNGFSDEVADLPARRWLDDAFDGVGDGAGGLSVLWLVGEWALGDAGGSAVLSLRLKSLKPISK